jgi:hypothetical protein
LAIADLLRLFRGEKDAVDHDPGPDGEKDIPNGKANLFLFWFHRAVV